MIVTTRDGQTYAGTARTIVAAMRDSGWLVKPKRIYKREVIERVMQLPSTPLTWNPPRNITNPQTFLDALVSAGLLTILPTH